jgi:hypothetical protein
MIHRRHRKPCPAHAHEHQPRYFPKAVKRMSQVSQDVDLVKYSIYAEHVMLNGGDG